ncbi:hypothetical protein Ciccas_005227 [Cichlidogyrus casuarinus]|uniref:Nesprin-1 n=1 Tax=Cichlidogyrus casuarinus TaxID=1844966 RepID=A0ABD2QA69_9PLAT
METKERMKQTLQNCKSLERQFADMQQELKVITSLAASGDSGNAFVPRLDSGGLKQELDQVEFKWALLNQTIDLEDTHVKSFDNARSEALRQLAELRSDCQRSNLISLPVHDSVAEIERKLKMLRNNKSSLKNKRVEFLNPAITAGQILLEDLLNEELSNKLLVQRVKSQMNSLEDDFEDLENLLLKSEEDCERGLNKWKQLNKSRQQIEDRLADYEYSLTTLAQGPVPGPRMLDAQMDWLDQCKDTLSQIEQEHPNLVHFLEQIATQEQDSCGVLDRYTRIHNEAQAFLLEASGQVEAYGHFDASLNELKNWLVLNQKRLDDYHSASGLLRRASGHTLEQRRELLINVVENVGESKVLIAKVKQAIDDLTRCRSRGSAVAASHAKTEFKNAFDHVDDVERFLDDEQKKVDQQLCSFTEWDVCLKNSEEWLAECNERFLSLKKEIADLRSNGDLLDRASTAHSIVYRMKNLKEELETRSRQQMKELTLKTNSANFADCSIRFETWQNRTEALISDVKGEVTELNQCITSWQNYGSARSSLLILIHDHNRRIRMAVRDPGADEILWSNDLCHSAIKDRKSTIEDIMTDRSDLELKKDTLHKMHSKLYDQVDRGDLQEIDEKIEGLINYAQAELQRCHKVGQTWDKVSSLLDSNRQIFIKASELERADFQPSSLFKDGTDSSTPNVDFQLAEAIEYFGQMQRSQEAMWTEHLDKNAKMKELASLQRALGKSKSTLSEIVVKLKDLNEVQCGAFEWLRLAERKLNEYFKSSSSSLNLIQELTGSLEREGPQHASNLTLRVNACTVECEHLTGEVKTPRIVPRISQLFMDRLRKLQSLSLQMRNEASSAMEHETELKNEIQHIRVDIDPIAKDLLVLQQEDCTSKRSCSDAIDRITANQRRIAAAKETLLDLQNKARDKPGAQTTQITDLVEEMKHLEERNSKLKEEYEAKSVCWSEVDQVSNRLQASTLNVQELADRMIDCYHQVDCPDLARTNRLAISERITNLETVNRSLRLGQAILKGEVTETPNFRTEDQIIKPCRQLALCYENLALGPDSQVRLGPINELKSVESGVDKSLGAMKEFEQKVDQWEMSAEELETKLDSIERELLGDQAELADLTKMDEEQLIQKKRQHANRVHELQLLKETFNRLQSEAAGMQRIGYNGSYRLTDDPLIAQRLKKLKATVHGCSNEGNARTSLWQSVEQEQAELQECTKKLNQWVARFEKQLQELDALWNLHKQDMHNSQPLIEKIKFVNQEKISAQLAIAPLLSHEQLAPVAQKWHQLSQERYPSLKEQIEKSIAEVDNIRTRVKVVDELAMELGGKLHKLSNDVAQSENWHQYEFEHFIANLDSVAQNLVESCEQPLLELSSGYPHRRQMFVKSGQTVQNLTAEIADLRDKVTQRSDQYAKLKTLLEQGMAMVQSIRDHMSKPELETNASKFALIRQYKAMLKKIQNDKIPSLRLVLQEVDQLSPKAQKGTILKEVYFFKESYANLGSQLLCNVQECDAQLEQLNELDVEYEKLDDWISQLDLSLNMPSSSRASKLASIAAIDFAEATTARFSEECNQNQMLLDGTLKNHREILNTIQDREDTSFKAQQLRCAGLVKLAKSVQDFDRWALDIMKNLESDQVLTSAEMRQLRFDLEMGSNKLKSMKETDVEKEELFLNSQIQRLATIYSGLESQLRQLESECSKKLILVESLAKQFEVHRDWLKSWDQKLNQLQRSVFQAADQSRDEASCRQQCNLLNQELQARTRDFELESGKLDLLNVGSDSHKLEKSQVSRMFKNAQIRLDAFVDSLCKMETQENAFRQRLKQAKLWLNQSRERLIFLRSQNAKNRETFSKNQNMGIECRLREQDLTQFFDQTADQGNANIADLSSLYSKMSKKLDDVDHNWPEADRSYEWASQEIENYQNQLNALLSEASEAKRESSRILALWNEFELNLSKWATGTTEAQVRLRELSTSLQNYTTSGARDVSPSRDLDTSRSAYSISSERQEELVQVTQVRHHSNCASKCPPIACERSWRTSGVAPIAPAYKSPERGTKN